MYYKYEPGYWYWDYNLTLTYTSTNYNDSYTLKGTFECVGDGDFWSYTDCTYSETYTENGTTYRVSNVTFSSTGSSYSFTARIYHSDHGYVEVEAVGLVYCANGGFSSGTITVSDSDSASIITVTYSGCDDPAVVTYQGSTFEVAQ